MKDKQLLFYTIMGTVVGVLFLASMYFSRNHFVWQYEPLYSTIEGFGALSAIFMAMILFQRKQGEGTGQLFWTAHGLLWMGLTSLFHAITRVGYGFIFLRSLSVLGGSTLFALDWLPQSFGRYESDRKWITRLVIAGPVLFGIWTLVAWQTLPLMIMEGRFSTTTIIVNLLAGVFFMLATARFLLELHRSNNPEFYFLSFFTLFFALAQFTFPSSLVWNDAWWFLELQRLLAYLILMGFIVHQHLQMITKLRGTIGEYKRTVAALKNAYAKLKETHMQLVQSAKMASIGQLASSVAHEINNPLTGVLNNLQLIKNEIEKGKDFNFDSFKEILNNSEESAIRCKNIIQSLLDFSYQSRSPLVYIFLNEIIEKTIPLLGYEMESQKVMIQTQFQTDLPQILGDAQFLQQAIFDILSNAIWAIKMSKKESGILTIKTQYEPEKNAVLLSISDNGIGIPKENLNRIFEAFFTTKIVGEGVGLGLFIVYGIIQQHRGTIDVESQVGKGTTFKISLPRRIF